MKLLLLSCLALSLFSSAKAQLKIGDKYKGGKIAYILKDGDKGYVPGVQHGLIAALADLGEFKWDSAKHMCSEYLGGKYKDWRLPNTDELDYLYVNRDTIGGFANGIYWSSSDIFDTNVYYQIFSHDIGSGIKYFGLKDERYHVRAVRSF